MEDKYVTQNTRTLEIFEEIVNGFLQIDVIKDNLGTKLKEQDHPTFKRLFIEWREKASPQLVRKSKHSNLSLKYTWREGLTREEIIEQGIVIIRKMEL